MMKSILTLECRFLCNLKLHYWKSVLNLCFKALKMGIRTIPIFKTMLKVNNERKTLTVMVNNSTSKRSLDSNHFTVNCLLLTAFVHNPQNLGRKNLVRIYNPHQLLTIHVENKFMNKA